MFTLTGTVIRYVAILVISALLPLSAQAVEVQIDDNFKTSEIGILSIRGNTKIFNDAIYFTARDVAGDYATWFYDGVNPPQLAWNISLNTEHEEAYDYFVFQDKLYFSLYLPVPLHEQNGLWVYDGINPPKPFLNGVIHRHFRGFKYADKLYFSGSDGIHGLELWMFDGVNPPAMLFDLHPGNNLSSSYPSNFIEFNGKLYFTARYGKIEYLWVYDGENPPWIVLIDTGDPKGIAQGYPSSLSVYNDKLYFSASHYEYGRQLWVYDEVNLPTMVTGTQVNAEEVRYTTRPIVFQNKLYYITAPPSEEVGRSYDLGVWSYDGINPATKVHHFGEQFTSISGLKVWKNKLYFVGSHKAQDRHYQPWVYDGIKRPELLKDTSLRIGFMQFKDKLYFSTARHKLFEVIDDGQPPTKPNDCVTYALHAFGTNDMHLVMIDGYANADTVGGLSMLDSYATVSTLQVTPFERMYYNLDLKGLDFHPNGTLYASSGDAGAAPSAFYKIDTDTGDIRMVTAPYGFAGLNDISFHPVDARLWSWAQRQGLAARAKVKTEDTLMKRFRTKTDALTWNDTGDKLYAVQNLSAGARLWRYDLETNQVKQACSPRTLPYIITTLETMANGHLFATYKGVKGAIYSGMLSPERCQMFEFEPIITKFDNLQSVAYKHDCL